MKTPRKLLLRKVASRAAVLGLVGSLALGKPADVTIFDPDREVTIDPEAFRSKGRNTPFGGWKLRGAAVATVVGGRRVRV